MFRLLIVLTSVVALSSCSAPQNKLVSLIKLCNILGLSIQCLFFHFYGLMTDFAILLLIHQTVWFASYVWTEI